MMIGMWLPLHRLQAHSTLRLCLYCIAVIRYIDRLSYLTQFIKQWLLKKDMDMRSSLYKLRQSAYLRREKLQADEKEENDYTVY